MARTFAVTYGSYVIGLSGTSSDVRPTDKITMEQDYQSLTVTFEVLVLSSSASAFATVEAALLAAYTKPDQDLTVVLGGQTRYTHSQSSNTGFNAQPSIEKLGGVEDTDRSARYRLSVTMGLPADLTGKDGRQSSAVSVSADSSNIRTVQISGVYTALASNSARAQFEASIDAYVATVKSALSITTWEVIGRPTEEDDDNGKALRFSRTFREVIRAQSQDNTDETGIVAPDLRIRRVENASNDTTELGQTEPMATLAVSYSASVDHTVTTDLDDLYSSTIRPHILAEAETLAGGPVAVLTESPSFDLDANRVFVSMSLRADSSTGLYAATVETQEIADSGEVRFVVWSGDPFHRDVYQGPKTQIMRRRKSVLQRAGTNTSLLEDPPQGYRENSMVRKTQSRTVGRSTDATFDTEFVVVSQEFERVNSVTSAIESVQRIADNLAELQFDLAGSFF